MDVGIVVGQAEIGWGGEGSVLLLRSRSVGWIWDIGEQDLYLEQGSEGVGRHFRTCRV